MLMLTIPFLCGAGGGALLFGLLAFLSRRRKPPGARERESETKVEFTKLILRLVMLVYFVGVGVGVKLSFVDPANYSTLAMLIGAPTVTAIGFYAWKAKAENVLKYHKENKAETEGATFDPGNMV